jgi:hypothetical protein
VNLESVKMKCTLCGSTRAEDDLEYVSEFESTSFFVCIFCISELKKDGQPDVPA